MRLTTKYLESENYFADEISEDATEEERNKYLYSIIDKLGQLEDIEDELDIDLITLFKALKDGIYTYLKNFKTGSVELYHAYIEIHSFQEFKVFDGCFMRFKDYGKTWALTKEELLNIL